MINAHKDGGEFEVRNSETRPLYQGRRTSKELVEAGIKTTMVIDDSIPYFIEKTKEKEVAIDMVIL